MKSLKRLSVAVIAVVLTVCMAAFVGCGSSLVKEGSGEPKDFTGKITLVLDDPDQKGIEAYFQVDAEKFEGKTGEDFLKFLKENGSLCYEGTSSEYGLFMTKIGTVKDGKENYFLQANDEKKTFLAVYTNVADEMIAEMDGKVIGSETVKPAKVGISTMAAKEATVILVTLGSY